MCAPELSMAEANEAYDCLQPELVEAWAPSGLDEATDYPSWVKVSSAPYVSATHGGRFVHNYANPAGAAAYTSFEDIDRMPARGKVAKPSFIVTGDGRVGPGPLFLMEKREAGFNPGTDDWRYSMVNPDGTLFGQTGGVNSDAMQFCADCHMAVADDYDSLLFLPPEFRAGN
jgi:hypothetical protein